MCLVGKSTSPLAATTVNLSVDFVNLSIVGQINYVTR